MIPEPDVLEGGCIVGNVIARQERIARQRSLLDSLGPNARLVAAMLCSMNGISRTCSLGVTMKRWRTEL